MSVRLFVLFLVLGSCASAQETGFYPRLDFEPFEEWFTSPWTRPGVKHTVQLSLGVRLGWVLAWGDTER